MLTSPATTSSSNKKRVACCPIIVLKVVFRLVNGAKYTILDQLTPRIVAPEGPPLDEGRPLLPLVDDFFLHVAPIKVGFCEDELHFVEQKCKLPKLLKPKKDGTRSVSTQKIDNPLIQHCRQTAFYYACTKKRPFLLYVNDKE